MRVRGDTKLEPVRTHQMVNQNARPTLPRYVLCACVCPTTSRMCPMDQAPATYLYLEFSLGGLPATKGCYSCCAEAPHRKVLRHRRRDDSRSFKNKCASVGRPFMMKEFMEMRIAFVQAEPNTRFARDTFARGFMLLYSTGRSDGRCSRQYI